MAYAARVLLDSIGDAGVRLTTMEVTFPRFVLSEFNTHRMFCLDGDTQLYFDVSAPDAVAPQVTMPLCEAYERWRDSGPERERLAAMRLRSCDERTGEIYHTSIAAVTCSGQKDVFRVRLADGREIRSSADHRFLTEGGWLRLSDAVDLGVGSDGIATWAKGVKFAANGVAVASPSGHVLVRHFVEVVAVESVGVRDTYDVEVSGPYHNFIANGFVVHNSRNSASSRAIPTGKLIERVMTDPVFPLEWGKNKPGMSASSVLSEEESDLGRSAWVAARDAAVAEARRLMDLHVHKQVLNRILEPFLWHTVIVTSTEWANFFELRCAPAAQPEIREAALLMRAALEESTPKRLAHGEWHLPLIQDEERVAHPIDDLKKASVARCARVSYLTHDGVRDIAKDFDLYERLRVERHLSPFEHVATPASDAEFHANFRGWIQMRASVEDGTRSTAATL